VRVVLCNCPPAEAERIARGLLEARVAACVNLVPGVRSLYWWQGAVCDEVETTLLIKTADDRVDALRATIERLHPYEVPEVVVLEVDVARSLSAYVDWVERETRGPR
jgi:periplasmic divalent cation tolerance protein